MRRYRNRWITDEALAYLAGCEGRILDVGGGLSPYFRADTIADIAEYDAERLTGNAWPVAVRDDGEKYKVKGIKGNDEKQSGEVHRKVEKAREGAGGTDEMIGGLGDSGNNGDDSSTRGLGDSAGRTVPDPNDRIIESPNLSSSGPNDRATESSNQRIIKSTNQPHNSTSTFNFLPSNLSREASPPYWSRDKYVQLDATKEKLPFADNEFDIGLCSHTLEDLDNPFPVVKELNRVSKQVVIITPSRLVEQTMGLDHPRICGFGHHRWMVEPEGDHVVFTRKSELLNEKGCHINCHAGRIMKVPHGVFFYAAENVAVRERQFDSGADEVANLSSYVDRFQNRGALFEWDRRAVRPRYWIWRFKQWAFGAR